MMIATPPRPILSSSPRRQAVGDTPLVFLEALDNDVNLAVWQRTLPPPLSAFAARVADHPHPLAESHVLEIHEGGQPVELGEIGASVRHLPGHGLFIDDLQLLVDAYACLLGAARVGLRLRTLDRAMCPRFHVDHVPLRLISTYHGQASQWLGEAAVRRDNGELQLSDEHAEYVQHMQAGDVALLKGEKWIGNEGHGIVHRSPALAGGERRLLVTLDWLG